MKTQTIRRIRRATLAASAVGMVTAGVATAGVPIYSQQGAPGGPPTPPHGGHNATATTKSGVTQLGNALAGYTNLQLVELQSFPLKVNFPGAGTIYGRISVTGAGELGEGFAGRANSGPSVATVSLSASGRNYLLSRGNIPTTLTLRFAYQTNKLKTEYSQATVTTAP